MAAIAGEAITVETIAAAAAPCPVLQENAVRRRESGIAAVTFPEWTAAPLCLRRPGEISWALERPAAVRKRANKCANLCREPEIPGIILLQ